MKVFIPDIVFFCTLQNDAFVASLQQRKNTMDSQNLQLWWNNHEGIYSKYIVFRTLQNNAFMTTLIPWTNHNEQPKTYSYDKTIIKVFIPGIVSHTCLPFQAFYDQKGNNIQWHRSIIYKAVAAAVAAMIALYIR